MEAPQQCKCPGQGTGATVRPTGGAVGTGLGRAPLGSMPTWGAWGKALGRVGPRSMGVRGTPISAHPPRPGPPLRTFPPLPLQSLRKVTWWRGGTSSTPFPGSSWPCFLLGEKLGRRCGPRVVLATSAPWSRLHLKVCKEGPIQRLKPPPLMAKPHGQGLGQGPGVWEKGPACLGRPPTAHSS